MSSTNTCKKDLLWALKTFRPILQALHKHKITNKPNVIFLSTFNESAKYNISNCCIVIQLRKLKELKDVGGFFVWRYDQESCFYTLYIFINEDLYLTDQHEQKVLRKGIRVHEFTHCVAAMLVFSRLESKELKRRLHEKMKSKFDTSNVNDIKQYLTD